jgi:hypothetical protein
MKTALALALAMAVALALALFIRALVYAVVDALRLLADRKKRAIRMNQEADAKVDDTHSLRERRFVWEFSLSLMRPSATKALIRAEFSRTICRSIASFSIASFMPRRRSSDLASSVTPRAIVSCSPRSMDRKAHDPGPM